MKRTEKRAKRPIRKRPDWKGELKKALRFVVLFLILFAAAYAALAFTPLKGFFGSLAAQTSRVALGVFGVQTQIALLSDGNYSLQSPSFSAELNEACSALIEIAVLFGIVFASFEKPLRERLKGFSAGMLVLLVLNPFRIALSIVFLNPLVHDVLFRITLIITIVGFYAIWYYGSLSSAFDFRPFRRFFKK